MKISRRSFLGKFGALIFLPFLGRFIPGDTDIAEARKSISKYRNDCGVNSLESSEFAKIFDKRMKEVFDREYEDIPFRYKEFRTYK